MTRIACWALRTAATLEEANLHLASFAPAGLLGIAEEAGRATVYLRERLDRSPLAGRWEPVADQDWGQSWKARIKPVTVGAITIAPPWLAAEFDASADAVDVVVIDPGQAFGTGDHDTTAGCIAALQETAVAGRRVLDVGTGTGVLGIVAARLGAVAVVAVDTDPLAVEAARANSRANGVRVDVRLGSLDSVAGERFDVIVANLDTATLTELSRPLSAALTPGGVLIASGVSRERASEALTAIAAGGLAAEARERGEWAVLIAR